MSNQIGRPARHAYRVTTSKGVLVTAAAVTTAAVVGVAYAIAAPSALAAQPVPASFVSAHVGSANARLSASGLDALLHARFSPVRSAVTDQGDQAAAQVRVMLGNGSGQVSPDGNLLTLSVPAVASIDGSVATALAPITARMGGLGGSDGEVAGSVNTNVTHISPLLSLRGSHANVTANVPIDLDAAVGHPLTGTSGAGAVTIHPHTGTVTIDLSKLLATDGTDATGGQTMSPAVIAEIGTDINAASASLGDSVVNSATNSVEGTPVTVHAGVNLLSPATTGSSCTSSGASMTNGGLLGGTLGSTLNGILGGGGGAGVGSTVNGLLCPLSTTLLPGLLTTLGLDVNGTVGQLVEGTAPPATGSVVVQGQPAAFNSGGINSGIANTLVNNFGGSTATGGSGSGTTASDGSNGLGIDVSVNGNTGGLGLGDLGSGGLGLGGNGSDGLSLGGLAGGNGVGVTPGFLESLLTGHTGLPLGVSAAVGTGSASGTATTGSSSGWDLLDINAATRAANGSVRVGTSAPAAGSSGSTGSSGTSGTSGHRSGILGGLLHVGPSQTSGGTNSGQALINLGL